MAEKMTDEELLAKVDEWLEEADEGSAEWRERASEARLFKRGDQWETADLEYLNSVGRPALTINRILPIVKFVCGAQRQARKDFRVRPVKNASNTIAEVLTALVNHAMGISQGSHQASESFEDGITTGKGWLKLSIDFDQDTATGEVKISRVGERCVFEDPATTRYDLEDAKYVLEVEWVDRDRLKVEYPGLEEEIDSDGPGIEKPGIVQRVSDWLMGRNAEMQENVEPAKHRTRILHVWWREYEKVRYSVDLTEHSTVEIAAGGQAQAKEIAKLAPDRFRYLERVKPVLHYAKIIGNSVAERKRDPLHGLTCYPLFRYCPYWEDGYVMGIIDNLIGPQTEENKRRSQVLHAINQIANSGWIVGRIVDENDRERLEEQGSKTGVVLDKSRYGDSIEKILPNPLPAGLEYIAGRAAEDLKEISGVANMMGFDSQEKESGKALALRQRQGMTILEGVFDNFDWTMRLLGTALMELIRRPSADGQVLYTDEEIAAIVDEENLSGKFHTEHAAAQLASQGIQPPTPPAQPSPEDLQTADPNVVAQFQQQFAQAQMGFQQQAQQYEQAVTQVARQMLMEELRAMPTGRYQVTMTLGASAPTVRMLHFAEMMELAQAYPGVIPPSAAIEASDLPNKEDLAAEVRQREAQVAGGPQR